MSLSVEERKLLAEAWVAAGRRHGVTITNHVAAAAITDSRELAAHAEAIGCAMIGAMPPYFFKSTSPAVIATWMKEIGAAAPNTREWRSGMAARARACAPPPGGMMTRLTIGSAG